MAEIIINNQYKTVEETIADGFYSAAVDMMDDDIRESVHSALAPCTDAEFLTEYLARATDDIVIG